MKSTQRRAASTAGFLALSFAAAPLFGQTQQPQQRGGPPNSDTPYILVTTFHSNDRQLGVQMGDELRKRLQQEHSAKELYVVPKMSINNTLEASGYRPDSALSASDLMELAKQLRGEQVIEGTVNKAGAGVKVEARILTKTGTNTIAQPLPAMDAKDAGDAAKQIERAITDANKAVPKYKECVSMLRAAKYPEAATAARAGLAVYANSNFNRICLLSAYSAAKMAPDSIIAVASAIRAVDPTSILALSNLADAYMTKGDTNNAIQANLAIYNLDRTNTAIATSIVQTLAQSGAPDKALPIIDSLLVQNPGDPQMLRTKWLLQLRLKRYKDALASGEEFIKADTSAATLDYFQRQIGAAQSDSNSAAVAQLVTRASQKYPKEASFNLLLAQTQMKAGQLQQALASARKASEANPKDSRPWLMQLAVFNQMNQPDSAIATAQKAIASGVSKDEIGAQLLAVASPALKKAQETKAREDWEAALKAAETVDAIAPSAQSSFIIGAASFQIATELLTDIQKLAKSTKKPDQAQACTEAKQAEDLLAKVAISMPKGGSYDKNTAGQILTAVPQYSEFLGSVKKAFCK